METLESLQRRINNAEDLHSIVRTMKTLAAVSIRQYERAVEALVEYNRTTELGLRVVLAGWAQELGMEKKLSGSTFGVVVFGSDQGMCGQFNDHVIVHALESMDDLQIDRKKRAVVSVGIRAAARLDEAGQTVEDIYSLPGSALGITPLVQRLLLRIERWRIEREVEQVYLFYNQSVSGVSYRPATLRLLPISIEQLSGEAAKDWSWHTLPAFSMNRERLLSALIRQHIFVLLFRTYAESLASENASRLMTMQVAEKNIDERLVDFYMVYHQLRQNTITSEILDIISGLEAQSGI